MIAKQMDVRSNIKKFFDLAYEGEPIIIPRKLDHNVVIISETVYNNLMQTSRVDAYSRMLSESKSAKPDTKGNVKAHNLEKLNAIHQLKDNWNGNDAPAFSKKLIKKVENLLNELMIQPEIFPTAMGSIQFEYDNARRDHMEIEINETDNAEVFIVNFNGAESFETTSTLPDILNAYIGGFYG